MKVFRKPIKSYLKDNSKPIQRQFKSHLKATWKLLEVTFEPLVLENNYFRLFLDFCSRQILHFLIIYPPYSRSKNSEKFTLLEIRGPWCIRLLLHHGFSASECRVFLGFSASEGLFSVELACGDAAHGLIPTTITPPSLFIIPFTVPISAPFQSKIVATY